MICQVLTRSAFLAILLLLAAAASSADEQIVGSTSPIPQDGGGVDSEQDHRQDQLEHASSFDGHGPLRELHGSTHHQQMSSNRPAWQRQGMFSSTNHAGRHMPRIGQGRPRNHRKPMQRGGVKPKWRGPFSGPRQMHAEKKRTQSQQGKERNPRSISFGWVGDDNVAYGGDDADYFDDDIGWVSDDDAQLPADDDGGYNNDDHSYNGDGDRSIINSMGVASISNLTPREKQVVDWVRTYTVPNTRQGNGYAWTKAALPSAIKYWSGYDASIPARAWAAAAVSVWSISEGIFNSGDFYRTTNTVDKRCPYFEFPPQLPQGYGFPIEVFTYNLCQGKAYSPNPLTNQDLNERNCACSSPCPGQMIGPNQKCIGRSLYCWQNGIWGMEQSHVVSAVDVATRAERIYQAFRGSSYTYMHVLESTLVTAGFPSGTTVYQTVMNCFPINPATGKRESVAASGLSYTCADLVSMWLTRNHLVGLTVAITDNLGWLPNHLNEVKVLAKYYAGM